MNGETEPIRRTPNPRQGANMPYFLAQLQSSGSIYFWKELPKSAIHNPANKQTAKLCLPKTFVDDHGAKFEEFVTLRVRTSSGRSSRSWLAHRCVAATLKVAIVGGWPDFVIDNHLQMGDFVVFVLREDAESEFDVHIFRGPKRILYVPDLAGERSVQVKEEETNKPSGLASAVRQQDEHNQVFRGDVGEGNPAPSQPTGNSSVAPRLSKRLKASNIGESSGESHSGQFEFPSF